jgi:hypothetical protein
MSFMLFMVRSSLRVHSRDSRFPIWDSGTQERTERTTHASSCFPEFLMVLCLGPVAQSSRAEPPRCRGEKMEVRGRRSEVGGQKPEFSRLDAGMPRLETGDRSRDDSLAAEAALLRGGTPNIERPTLNVERRGLLTTPPTPLDVPRSMFDVPGPSGARPQRHCSCPMPRQRAGFVQDARWDGRGCPIGTESFRLRP